MNWLLGGITAALAMAVVVQTARLDAEQAQHAATIDKHAAAVAEHNRAAADAVREIIDRAAQIAADTYRVAMAAQAEAEARVLARTERIRHVTHTIEVPAGCPVSLPASVQDELAAAVSDANAAAGPLRARPDAERSTGASELVAGWPGMGRYGPGDRGARAHGQGSRARVPEPTAG